MRNVCGIILLLSLNAYAELNITQTETEYSAIGYSNLDDAASAEKEACNNARRDLISYIFGAAYQVNQNSVRSLGVVEYAQDVSMNTSEVILRSVLLDRTPLKPYKCVLHYPVSEAVLERARLSAQASAPTHTHFTEIGTGSEKGGVLEIITVPEDVPVYIDNQHWGTTPLRLNKKLAVGSHLIRLDHQNYEVVEEKIEVGFERTNRVHRILKRAISTLNVDADLENTQLSINGQEVGKSPLIHLSVVAGEKIVLSAKHAESEDYSQTLVLERGETRILKLILPRKAAYLSFDVSPLQDTHITIDTNHYETSYTPNQWIKLEPGEHEIQIEKEGFETAFAKVELHGGEKKALDKITLVRVDPEHLDKRDEDGAKSGGQLDQPSLPWPVKYTYQKMPDASRQPASEAPDYLGNQILFGGGYGKTSYKISTQPTAFACCVHFDLGYKRALSRSFTFGLTYRFAGGEMFENTGDDGSISKLGSTLDRYRSYSQHEAMFELQLYLGGG